MAKKAGGSRLRVFFAEFDGDDETVREGLRTIAAAVNKTFQPKVVVKRLPSPAENGEADAIDVEFEQSAEEAEDSFEEDGEQQATPSKRGNGSKRKPPTLSLVKELDLRPKGKESWRVFYESKAPQKQIDKITLAVYYLCNVLEISGVTANHVYTCLKDVSVKIPNDLPQTMRNIANSRGIIDVSNSSDIKITI